MKSEINLVKPSWEGDVLPTNTETLYRCGKHRIWRLKDITILFVSIRERSDYGRMRIDNGGMRAGIKEMTVTLVNQELTQKKYQLTSMK